MRWRSKRPPRETFFLFIRVYKTKDTALTIIFVSTQNPVHAWYARGEDHFWDRRRRFFRPRPPRLGLASFF